MDDELLAKLYCRELSLPGLWAAKRHLARCAECRRRKQRLEGPRAARMLELYREDMDDAEMNLPARPRAVFSQWLQEQLREAAAQDARRDAAVQSEARGGGFQVSVRSLAFALVLTLAVGVSITALLRWQQNPGMGADEFMVRAAKVESIGFSTPGVIHQTVRIKTARMNVQRSLYWDRQGVRRVKGVALDKSEQELRAKLDAAGVDWDQPISAASYRHWQNHHARVDRIARSGTHLMTVTATAAEGDVAEESLTVRDTDMHPVERKIDFRNHETVEIAELDYSILPWNAVDASIFEPLNSLAERRTPAFVPLPFVQTPTPGQLDEDELSARLILNRMHADEGEQIEIRRLPEAVEVDGVVDSEERKRQLVTQLMMAPRLKISIQSEADWKASQSIASIRVEERSLPDTPSALAVYERARGRSVDESSNLARQLFDEALAVSHEANAIADLNSRYNRNGKMPVVASATLETLIYSHHERLEDALRKEHALLRSLGQAGAASSSNRALGTLVEEATRNLALMKELTQTNLPATRTAEAIFADLSSTADRIAASAAKSYGPSSEDSARNTSTKR
jgi:hypothetical protein